MIKDIEKAFEKSLEHEKIVSTLKRCPKCHELSLEYDIKNNSIKCSKCGFTQDLKR
jgi:ribosomal protein S27AE